MMPVTANASLEVLAATRHDMHPRCVVCGRPGLAGLGLKFQVQADGSVTADFDRHEDFEGYSRSYTCD